MKTEEDLDMKNRLSLLTIMGLAVLTLGVSACNTIEGAGEDIERAGESVQDAAN